MITYLGLEVVIRDALPDGVLFVFVADYGEFRLIPPERRSVLEGSQPGEVEEAIARVSTSVPLKKRAPRWRRGARRRKARIV